MHRYNIFLSLSIFLSFFICFMVSANDKTFDQRYNEVYSDKISSNVIEAERIADSLYQHAKGDLQRIKALMLLANIKHSTGDIPPALLYAVRAHKIAELDGFLEWESRTAGFLATTYRNVGLYSESRKYLKRAERANEKQRQANGYVLTKINILQENAFHAMNDANYEAALKFLNEAKQYAERDTSSSPRGILVRATNDQLVGVCYLNTNKLSLADSSFFSSLQLLGDQESNLRPYINRGLAEVALMRNKLAIAEDYLEEAMPYIASSNREELKLLLYESYAKLYSKTRDLDRASHYKDLHAKALENRTAIWQNVADQLLNSREMQQQRFEKQTVVIAIVVIALGLIFICFLILRNRRVDTSIPIVRKRDAIALAETLTKGISETDDEVHIAEETEQRLLSVLEELESTQFYLQTDITLSKLSSVMHSNVRYVSYIFRKYRAVDFNTYLQKHRIAYIVKRLDEDPNLLNCKISYLASLCGFSTHGKFSIAFRAETGLLPSEYIQQLRDKEVPF
ncbi:helix-turn-helix domain-containing protein [Sphingobacterium pedocola]|uniref:HTH araC/xylS-type domain-containing protein n=1 Tax=Sphingobacterium pedocola TaxID=2082722 RepID=A0ABR9T9U0_9SPHI|nr:helix-turn-helix domain-containing protein [Sphingobacterium pedocola]MBE8722083.1 hypothetical protein [Sphingobacterium pedocola]